MDCTIGTVPTIFRQLYTIHAPDGGKNSEILPLAYVLKSTKSEVLYTRFFQDLVDFSEETGEHVNSSWIITNFE